MSIVSLSEAAREVLDGPHTAVPATSEKTLLHEMYARYMGGATPPPEPDAERLIVRIVPERGTSDRRWREETGGA